jgi:prolyl oligopeptidase
MKPALNLQNLVRWTLVASLAAPTLAALAGEIPAPPETKKVPVKEDLYGVEYVDNYRWLEGDNSDPKNMGKATPEVEAWTEAQNAYTRSVLDNIPGRKAVEEKIKPLMEVGSISSPTMRGDRYFFTKREASQNQPLIYYRDGYKGETRLLIDPATIDPSGLVTVTWFVPSHDGRLLAYGTYRAGDENATLHLLQVDGGKKLDFNIPSKVSEVTWLPDNSGVVYRNLADANNPYSGQVMYVGLNEDVARARLIMRQFTREENAKLATTYGPEGGLDRSGKWLELGYATDTRNNDLWVASFDEFRKTGKVNRVPILVGEKASAGGTILDDVFYVQTTWDAPNGRIFAVDLKKPERTNWKEIVSERKDANLVSMHVSKSRIAAVYLKNASSQIDIFDHAGKAMGSLKLPGIGSAGIDTEEDRDEAYLSFTSYNYPTTIFRVDLTRPDAAPELWERPPVPVDPSTVEVKQEWYSSSGGARIPMFIVHKKGLKLDGSNPTILYGYGGFNISQTPTFSATNFQWYDAGGVYAVANLRGGGEFGMQWHEAGKLEKKQNTWDDFQAAAEFLIQSGYTNPKKLAVAGGSQGGLLVGSFVTQRPDLCRAALCMVPLIDMLRFHNFLMARYWVPEYGSAEEKSQFEYIRKYSPYQNVKKGTAYPAMIVTAGEHDARVHPSHARKFVAALRDATSSGLPILYWGDKDAGHGQGKPLNLRMRDLVDQRIFLMWQLGMLEGAPN